MSDVARASDRGPVLITGAAGGIGQAVARRLAHQGARLALVGRSAAGLGALAGELRERGAEVLTLGADLATLDEPGAAVERTVEHFGELGAVISNAGINSSRTSLVELTAEEYEKTFAVNTRATWLLARAAHPHLVARRGTLVAVDSMSGSYPASPLGAYSASKAALVLLVQQLAFEWGPDGVTCNTISPGMIMTPMSPAAHDAALRERRAARYITGQDLVVDGGVRTAFFPTLTALA